MKGGTARTEADTRIEASKIVVVGPRPGEFEGYAATAAVTVVANGDDQCLNIEHMSREPSAPKRHRK